MRKRLLILAAAYAGLLGVFLLPCLIGALVSRRWDMGHLRHLLFAAGPGIAISAAFITLSILFAGPLKDRLQRLREGKHRWVPVLAGPVGFVGFMSLIALGQGGSFLARLVDILPVCLLILGISLAGLCVYRSSRGKFCIKCGYELSWEVESSSHADSRCPECGALWMLPQATRRGQRQFRPRPLVLGIAVIGLALVAIRAAFPGGRSALLRLLPTGSIITEVVQAPRGFTMTEWAELSGRRLSPAQERRLAEGLLAQRSRKQYLAREADGWLEAAALAGKLGPALTERYFGEMMNIWLIAPDHAPAGQPITIGLGSEHRGPLGPPATLQPFILFEGFRLGEQTGVGRANTFAGGLGFGLESRSFGNVTPGDGPAQRFTLPPGRTRTQAGAAYWLVVMPANPPALGMRVSWTDEGLPVLPPQAVWSRRYELNKAITAD
jgi:hypothetical protein